jgi:hypothetical protein
MIVSAELRWFWKDAVPQGLEPWFASSGLPPGGGRPRDDVYLLDPAQRELSLKHRGKMEGVEVKGLIRRVAPPISAGPLFGHVELWIKWNSAALSLEHLPSIIVRKRRRMREFDTSGARVDEIALGPDECPAAPGTKDPEDGCTLELTEVSLTGREGTWWTLSLEAFGALERVESNLGRTLAHLQATQAPGFAPGVEKSYACWLAERGIG